MFWADKVDFGRFLFHNISIYTLPQVDKLQRAALSNPVKVEVSSKFQVGRGKSLCAVITWDRW